MFSVLKRSRGGTVNAEKEENAKEGNPVGQRAEKPKVWVTGMKIIYIDQKMRSRKPL